MNLDMFCLMYETLENYENLSKSDIITGEIVENLEYAEQFAEIEQILTTREK